MAAVVVNKVPMPAHGLCFVKDNSSELKLVQHLEPVNFTSTSSLMAALGIDTAAGPANIYFSWWNNTGHPGNYYEARYSDEEQAVKYYTSKTEDKSQQPRVMIIGKEAADPWIEQVYVKGATEWVLAKNNEEEFLNTIKTWIVGADAQGIGDIWERPPYLENTIPVIRVERTPKPLVSTPGASPSQRAPAPARHVEDGGPLSMEDLAHLLRATFIW